MCRYAARLHAAIGPGHQVASPLGAWLLLALVGPAAAGPDRVTVTDPLPPLTTPLPATGSPPQPVAPPVTPQAAPAQPAPPPASAAPPQP